MPIPSAISDLSQTAADNYPTGSEVIGANLDNYLRAHGSFIRQPYALAGASVASASTTNVSASDGESVLITGTTTITSLGVGFIGCKRELRFEGALTLTHSSGLVLPGAADITTAAGDAYTFRCTDASTWVMVAGSVVGSGGGGASYTPVVVNANTTLDGTHVNQQVEKTSSTSYTFTIPPGLGASGDAILFVNNSTGSLIISRGSGVALYRYGTNANVTIPAHRSMLVVLTTTANTWQSA